ncbi:MAG TPA: deoxyribodipyrimidine photolyase [Vicinamibacteria bacterium]|nr:deoxyribodipyrimidine photolyase [Vicinamibacteria bacterium]
MSYNGARLRRLNEKRTASRGEFVLYWMQAYRRLDCNHALDYAIRCAHELERPLVVYEGLRLDYPWASRRLHHFVLEGMAANAEVAKQRGLNYWPFVETKAEPGRGLLLDLARRASMVVTDDFPCFIVPRQSAALARQAEVPVFAVDSNSVVPLSLLGPAVGAAAHLRPRIHKAFAEAWGHRAARRPRLPAVAAKAVAPPFAPWKRDDLGAFVRGLPLDDTVPPVEAMPGGPAAAGRRLRQFLGTRLAGYAETRSRPTAPGDGRASGLSPYLHFGHISIQEVVEAALETTGRWTPDDLRVHARGRREGFFTDDADVNGFLDEAVTWRDVGFQWHWSRRDDTRSLEKALPAWALATLRAHGSDKRSFVYSPAEWEAGATHDPLWNAAQRELVATGTIHNYLRMLWGKKVLEWSRSPEEAYATLEHLNNKYALDGRDPNSYTGILWCFGLFDRPWAPERKVLGVLRYMSSENTARKFKLGAYYEYVNGLPAIEAVRRDGATAGPSPRP